MERFKDGRWTSVWQRPQSSPSPPSEAHTSGFKRQHTWTIIQVSSQPLHREGLGPHDLAGVFGSRIDDLDLIRGINFNARDVLHQLDFASRANGLVLIVSR